MVNRSFQLLACEYINGQLDKLQKELLGAKSTNEIECIHQARVASRRLRAALDYFTGCFPAKKKQQWLKQISKITKKLGAARDRDVQIKFIQDFHANLNNTGEAYKPGINRLLLRLRQNREEIQPKVVKSIDEFNASRVLNSLSKEINQKRSDLKGKNITLQSFFVFQRAKEHIGRQVKKLLSYQESLNDPLDKNHHHQMRIAAKNLRYTLEICNPAFEESMSNTIKNIKKIQTCLGIIHDYDVWNDYLEEFIKEEEKLTIAYFGYNKEFENLRNGLVFLQEQCRERRKQTFNEFREFWQKFNEDELWTKLDTQIEMSLQQYQK